MSTEPAPREEGPPPRASEAQEWLPQDYFRRATVEEIFPERPEAFLEVDLGCGDGRFLERMGAQFPERNFLGVERLLGRVRKVSRKAERAGLQNVKVLRLESAYAIEWLLPRASVNRLHLLCPDPWPKAKHHKRRLFQLAFLRSVAAVLKPGGEFCFKTDHLGYFEWAEEVLEDCSFLERLAWPSEAFFYAKTDFQELWEGQGKSLRRLRLRKP
ncbi:MAG: tRNA (guanosine(46)-N7)-methyltransferase TrmB [Verrucomicrobiota bacterium]